MAAGAALLKARARCLLERSVVCLDRVDQQDSAALQADVGIVRTLQSGGIARPQPALDKAELNLQQRLGDSALVQLVIAGEAAGSTASALLVKVDGLWRIRDLTIG